MLDVVQLVVLGRVGLGQQTSLLLSFLFLPLGLVLAFIASGVGHEHFLPALLRGRHGSVPHFLLDLLVGDQVVLRLDGGCVFDAREFVL